MRRRLLCEDSICYFIGALGIIYKFGYSKGLYLVYAASEYLFSN
jgi:hypothetical protein